MVHPMVFPTVRQTQSDRWLLQIQKNESIPMHRYPLTITIHGACEKPLASDAFRCCSTRGPSSNFSRLRFANKISDKHSAPGSKNDCYGYKKPRNCHSCGGGRWSTIKFCVCHISSNSLKSLKHRDCSDCTCPKVNSYLWSMVWVLSKGDNGTTSAHG